MITITLVIWPTKYFYHEPHSKIFIQLSYKCIYMVFYFYKSNQHHYLSRFGYRKLYQTYKILFHQTNKSMNKIPAYQTLDHKKWKYKHKWILKSSYSNLKHADHNTFKRRLTLCTQIYLWDEEVCALQKNQKCLSNHNKQMDWQHIAGIMIKRTIQGVVFLLFPCHSTIRC